jgi:hypothetical protein
VSRNTSLNGIGRRPLSLLDHDATEAEAGGRVCEIDCVRLARFGRFVAVDDELHVVARSGRFLWPATDTTAPQSESAQFRLETLCDQLRREGWEQRATGSGRAWYAHVFLASVPAGLATEANAEAALASAPGSGSRTAEPEVGEPGLSGHLAGPTPGDELARTPPVKADLAEEAGAASSSVESDPVARPDGRTAEGFEPDRLTPVRPWYRAPRAIQTTLGANAVSNLCDRVTEYTTSAHE